MLYAPGEFRMQKAAARKVSLRHRVQYRFDSIMALGTPALIALLAVATLAMVGLISIVLLVLGAVYVDDGGSPADSGTPANIFKLLQIGMNHAFNTGNIWGENGGGAPYFISMVAVSLGGMFVLSALIGILTNGLDNRIFELRKGRSNVLETDHTIVLGWSSQIFPILTELAAANANHKRFCVVVMANKDKVEMEDEIHDKVRHRGNVRVVCRTGNPIDLTDLDIVNLPASNSIIVLAPDIEDPDSEVLKTVLAITKSPHRRKAPYHIVAQIRDPKNMEAAHLVGGHETQYIDVGDAVARLVAQTCRQSGLSVVYNNLLDFEGDEIYFKHEPSLVGKAFGDVLDAYERCTVIGLLRGERPTLNPPMDTVIDHRDQLILIAEDDSKIVLSPHESAKMDTGPLHGVVPREPKPERTLILGWNWRAHKIISELDSYVAPGSVMTVMSSFENPEPIIRHHCEHVRNQTINVVEGDTSSRRRLEALNVASYEHIIVLSYSDNLDPQRADARTLITLLNLRDLRRKSGKEFSIVSEMQDIRNKELADVARADDLIVSDKLISLMTAQICENRHLKEVFGDIFNAGGDEIYMHPSGDYVRPGSTVDFYAIVEAARRMGQVALGYRIMSEDENATEDYGIVLNPPKKQQVTLSANDKVVVLAES
jgi:voltage-gated potassium channel Kch